MSVILFADCLLFNFYDNLNFFLHFCIQSSASMPFDQVPWFCVRSDKTEQTAIPLGTKDSSIL